MWGFMGANRVVEPIDIGFFVRSESNEEVKKDNSVTLYDIVIVCNKTDYLLYFD